MKNDIHELANWAIDTAKAAGADDCRVGISSERQVEVKYRKRKPENIKEASTKALFFEVFVDGRYSGQSTSDMRSEPLKDFIKRAVASTKLLAEDPFRILPEPKYYEGRAETDLGLVDPGYENLTPGVRHKMVRAMEEACLAKGGEKCISASATGRDYHTQSYTATSNGFEGQSESTVFVAVAEMTAQDEGDRRPAAYDAAVSVSLKNLPDPEKIGAGAAERTLAMLGAKKLKTETLPIIIENRVVPRILGGFLEAMFARNIQQKQSFLADKKGHKIASDCFTIIDDPFIVGGLGSRLFDGDGFSAKKRTMVDKGVLKEFFVDWYYSRKLDWEPTSGSPSNLVIPSGKRSVKEIMKDLGRGIFITGFIGGNSNSTTGDASIRINGQLFEDGKPVQAV